MHTYEVRPRKDHRGVLLPMRCHSGRLWYGEPERNQQCNRYAKFRSRSHDAVIRVYDEGGNLVETHEHAGEFQEW